MVNLQNKPQFIMKNAYPLHLVLGGRLMIIVCEIAKKLLNTSVGIKDIMHKWPQ